MANEIPAPMPGTFYRAPSPDQPPFVADGGTVKAGETIGLIEVMKSFYEVKAEKDGRNARFLVKNEDPVTAGTVLVELD